MSWILINLLIYKQFGFAFENVLSRSLSLSLLSLCVPLPTCCGTMNKSFVRNYYTNYFLSFLGKNKNKIYNQIQKNVSFRV